MRSLLIASLILAVASLRADVIISEFLASNGSVIQDDDQDYSDYIELHNTGGSAVPLDGYFLTDNANNLTTVPSVSLVIPPDDLWDGDTGIYVNSHKDAGSDDFWERAGSIEYIDPNSDVAFSASGGMRIFGGAAAHPNLSDKMGFRVTFRSEYGVGRLETEMFERVGPGANNINTIVLRSHWGSSFLRNPELSNWAKGRRSGVSFVLILWPKCRMLQIFTTELQLISIGL